MSRLTQKDLQFIREVHSLMQDGDFIKDLIFSSPAIVGKALELAGVEDPSGMSEEEQTTFLANFLAFAPEPYVLEEWGSSKDAEGVVAMVEANSNETTDLWARCHTRCDWKQISRGNFVNIGVLKVDNEIRSVCMTIFYAIIDSRKIGFWEPTSQFVDYRMVEEWLAREFPRPEVYHTNAMNFSNAFRHIQALNEKASNAG